MKFNHEHFLMISQGGFSFEIVKTAYACAFMDSKNKIVLIPGTMANCYDVLYRDRRYLVDAGTKSSGKKIISYYDEINTKPDIILITHYHSDHMGGLKLINERFGSQIYVPDGEIDVIKGNRKMEHAGSFMLKLISLITKVKGIESVKPVSEFHSDGIEILDTRGHTPDSRTFLFNDLNALFTGDSVMMRGNVAGFSNTFTLDQKAAKQSLEKIMNNHGMTCYPGHGSIFRIE